ncbi:MAG: hypothetical protein QM790_10835 [Nibricoccus sp.]
MIERSILAVNFESAGLEESAVIRDRLKGRFPAGAARRMTQLGMLIGSVLGPLEPAHGEAVIYASSFGETRALEGFLESFPHASPTLFQTSIHPSGVQQGLIGRQRSLAEVFPFAGTSGLVGHALLATLLNPAPRVFFCGGDERGGWLREEKLASDTSFAFAVALGAPSEAELGKLIVRRDDSLDAKLSLEEWFSLLDSRKDYSGPLLPGQRLELIWKKP